ncbi:MAG: rod shape-determining protein MreC [Candidatus Marinimicrobia bacterium]|jgi:rod shape-determining protein MreC|nr:rod shape-determining protein MreC [Candidatus Neomarinimicrobiota bacterium]MBT3502330.1 rod shape-determining protein MreC [Candidatus Neomarinimicrobiota bacterium]MBT3840388.1 rod shape-determining protein MreC [Candidatus Neomarinimicrobiota bacterium]MBT3999453.1 rod shape-determining protein MreC [Candidatus Neomarinimicrobiota bacterium]MBT4282046.1 rod shape-determining protein MreC [Candidatus Neomarinimicrobiota bacterium]
MRGLYLAIVRNKNHFLFLLSLFFSSILLLNNDNQRMYVIRGKSTEIVAFISSPVTWIKSLMFLEDENSLLRESTLSLSLQVESMLNLQKENEQLLEMLDFKRQTKIYLKPARVVNKGLQPNLLSIVIDVGTNDGVKANQTVLTPKGVIGKTISAGETATVVQLITDINYRLSVRIIPSGATGILRWLGVGKGQVREVQKNVNINIGDKIITSGFSDIYPSGLPVGEVAGVLDERGSFQKILNVNLPNDMSSFQYVFVIVDANDEME